MLLATTGLPPDSRIRLGLLRLSWSAALHNVARLPDRVVPFHGHIGGNGSCHCRLPPEPMVPPASVAVRVKEPSSPICPLMVPFSSSDAN